MKMKIRKSLELGIALAAIVPLVMAGCSSSSSAPAAAGGTSTDVRSALNQTLQNGEVVIAQFRRSNLSVINNLDVDFVTEVTNTPGITDGLLSISAGMVDSTGQANMALAAGAYKQFVSGTGLDQIVSAVAASAVNAVASTLIDVNVGGAAPASPQLTVYRGEEYVWNITTPAASSVSVTLVQVDPATGLPNYGSGKYQVRPLGGSSYVGLNSLIPAVLTAATSSFPAVSFTSSEVRTEVLPGSYRAVITALGSAGLVAAPFVSNVFTSTAATAKTAAAVVRTVTLQTGATVSLTLLDATGTGLSRTVEFYDTTTYVPLASVSTSGAGVANFRVPSTATSVIAKVGTEATYVFSNLPTTTSATLQLRTVSGTMTRTGCSTPSTVGNIGTVTIEQSVAALQSTLIPSGSTTTVVESNGDYSLSLFGQGTAGLQYTLNARNVLGCPTPTARTVSVLGAPLTLQNLSIANGGTVSGKINDRTNVVTATALPGVGVDIWQSTASGYQLINSDITDVNGNYSIEIPYGTYMLWANGSVTENIVVSAASPLATKNLMQYNLVGAISKNTVGALQVADSPTVRVGTYSAPANRNGVYSIPAMEGKTWFCVVPGGNDLAYATQCNLNVLIDAATVAAAGQ